jgi:hypothetical protein
VFDTNRDLHQGATVSALGRATEATIAAGLRPERVGRAFSVARRTTGTILYRRQQRNVVERFAALDVTWGF